MKMTMLKRLQNKVLPIALSLGQLQQLVHVINRIKEREV